MLSSLASFFPMISPRAESIAPETQGEDKIARESQVPWVNRIRVYLANNQHQLIGRVDFASAALVHLLRRKLTLCQRIQDPGHPLRVQIFKSAADDIAAPSPTTGARTKDGTCFPKSISPGVHSNSLIIESGSEGDSPPKAYS
ncbi:hypothetical protein L195_g027386, partial [Trifolium pratense]